MYIDHVVKKGEETSISKIEVRLVPIIDITYEQHKEDCKRMSSTGKIYELINNEYREVK